MGNGLNWLWLTFGWLWLVGWLSIEVSPVAGLIVVLGTVGLFVFKWSLQWIEREARRTKSS